MYLYNPLFEGFLFGEMPKKSEVKIEVITDKPLSSMEVWQKWLNFLGVSLRFQKDEKNEEKKEQNNKKRT
jgi:hypothetical protein